jgi:hypothetical protein
VVQILLSCSETARLSADDALVNKCMVRASLPGSRLKTCCNRSSSSASLMCNSWLATLCSTNSHDMPACQGQVIDTRGLYKWRVGYPFWCDGAEWHSALESPNY